MATTDSHSTMGPNDVPCPDPSVHEKSHHQHKLSEQASTAALYVTHPDRERAAESRASDSRGNPLGADGKLSSKSAAASLKYAKPQDLPSFPSSGNAADSAGKAAMLAKDYKMKDLWQPEQSKAGSKAALLAHGKGGKLDLWQASATSDGHSAATLAMRAKDLGPNVDYGVTTENRNKALLAATKSHLQGRQRAGSTPPPALPKYPDSQNSGTNALNAATISHSAALKGTGDGWNSEANQAARIKNLGNHMDREMFGEHPPVEIEREEARYQAALRASAVSMAKQIYATQDRTAMTTDTAEIAGAQAAASRTSTTTQPDLKQEAMRYINLQEAAHKLAAERLAKVDKNFEAAQYREYYGYGDKSKRMSSRLSLRSGSGRQRRRASSEGTANLDDSDDEEQARRIRSQMSQLHSGLSKVDEKKQQDDRAKLLAAAEKRVSARMHNMDEKVFADTGKVPPALMEEWEEKARERAQREREQQAQNPGKTHIGGGKFMDQAEIEAIAAARLKPTLDEINDNAEKRRARDEELRQEKEDQERQKQEEKARNREEKEEQKRMKNEEKARKEEEKRAAKEEKRKSREAKREEMKDIAVAGAGGAALAEVAEKVREGTEQGNDDAAEAVLKHRSALSRLKEKFRRSQAGDSAADQQDHEDKSTGVAAGATAGATAGAVTGATLADQTEAVDAAAPAPLDSQQAAHAVTHDETDEKAPISPGAISPATPDESVAVPLAVPVAVPVAEPEHKETIADDTVEDPESDKWKPVAVAATAGAGAAAVLVTSPEIHVSDPDEDKDAEVETPVSSSKPARPPFEQKPSLSGYHNDEILQASNVKPNLERHISQIPESEPSDSSDDEWNDEDDAEPSKLLGASRAQDVADRAVSSPVTDSPAEPPVPLNTRTAAQLDDQRADPPKDLPSSLESPGVPKALPLVATAAATDAVVQSKANESPKDHAAGTAVVVPVDPVTSTKEQDKAEPAKLKKKQEATDVADEQEPEKSEPTKLKKKQEPTETAEEPDKERKGLRGFLKKLRNKDSKSENKTVDSKSSSGPNSVPYESTEEGEKPVTGTGPGSSAAAATSKTVAADTLPQVDAGPSLEERMGTDGPIGDSKHVSGLDGNPRPESPSSFRRGEANLNDPDDVSSSGVDEEDISRGRGGRLVQKLGFGSRKDKPKTSDEDAAAAEVNRKQSVSGTEDEQFEEARDHFDENLAPPPAFAGQAKSESPVRETRFQEQL